MNTQLPAYAKPLFKPKRYKVIKGGRGSAKSFTVAKSLLLKGKESKRFILCAREFQNSINDSVLKLLEEQIIFLKLEDFYTIKNNQIIGKNGTVFIFKGLWRNLNSLKSIPGITDLWLEEAHTVSKLSWDVLVPTIREEGSEIWVTYNPELEDDPTHVKFCGPLGPPDDALVIEANWRDNPWFPNVLKKEMEHMKRTNYELYMHVWEGECRTNGDAQIFKNKWRVDTFEVNEAWDGPYFGTDWGFSVDPLALTKVYLDFSGPLKRLMIIEEAGGVGIDFDDIPKKYNEVSGAKGGVIRADNARPETISYLKKKGWNIQAADKWKGSVEDGIEFMKSFDEIVVHERCTETHTELRKYSYKIDRLTGDITTDIVDAYNHYIDSIRYGLDPMIQSKASLLDFF